MDIDQETLRYQNNLFKKHQEQGVETVNKGLQPIRSTISSAMVRCPDHGNDYPCSLCEEESRKEEERKRLLEEEKLNRKREEREANPEPIIQACGVGLRHRSCSFENFQGGEKIKAACKELLKKPSDIVLTGGPGSGKTHLAIALIRELVKEMKINGNKDCRFVTAPELIQEIQDSFRDGSEHTSRDIIKKYAFLSCLVLDDIGAEKITDWSVTTLYNIIDRRYREMLPTIYTTNLSLEEIDEFLSPRIASRMSGALILSVDTGDFRKKRQAWNRRTTSAHTERCD